jgi:hypothetical protein
MSSLINAPSLVFNSQSQFLFGRCYSLSIGAPGQTAALQYANFNPPGQTQPLSALKIRFDIQKNLIGSPNKSKIEVFNFSQQTRQAIKVGWIVQLQVGYKNLVETIFIGNINPAGLKSDRNGADIITVMECGDGESSISTSVLNKTYPPGSTLAQILQDIAIAMNTTTATNPVGVGSGIAVGIPNVVYGRGKTISGACKDTLNTLLQPQGLRWSVQNGALDIIPAIAYNGDSAIVVSSATGMIGTPSKNDQYTEFSSLLNPKLVPGALVQLISENTALNGFYKVLTAHYEGDSHDSKWQVHCQCTEMSNVQTLPVASGNNYTKAVTS